MDFQDSFQENLYTQDERDEEDRIDQQNNWQISQENPNCEFKSANHNSQPQVESSEENAQNDQQKDWQISEENQSYQSKIVNLNSQSQSLVDDDSYQQIVNEWITTKKLIIGNQHTENNEIAQQKKSNQIKVIGEKQKPKQNQNEDVGVKYYPGDSKNIPKNFGGHFKNFIKEVCELNQVDLDDQDWQVFHKIKNQKISKYNLGEFLLTKYGRMFGKEFFGQCLWAKPFLIENKSDIQQYFAFNKYNKKVKTNDYQ